MGEPSSNTSGRRDPIQSRLVEGLDSTIVIDPRRLHLTLGVMALEPSSSPTSSSSAAASPDVPAEPPKTVQTALDLLQSLRPRIRELLGNEEGLKVPLDVLDVLNTKSIPRADNQDESHLGASVLFLGPDQSKVAQDENKRKLDAVCQLINRAFLDAGYLTDRRPLTLHCTILNASHRRPKRWLPFSYTDIRSTPSHRLLSINPARSPPFDDSQRGTSLEKSSSAAIPTSTPPSRPIVPPPLSVDLGPFFVDEVQLWIMGSRGPNNEYISCGGIKLTR